MARAKILPALCGDPACPGPCHARKIVYPVSRTVKDDNQAPFEDGMGGGVLYRCELCGRSWDSKLYKPSAQPRGFGERPGR